MEQRFCANCGTGITSQAVFCPNCGQAVDPEMAHAPTYAGLAQPAVEAAEYMGFWIRLLAWVIDLILITVVDLILTAIGLRIISFFVGPVYWVLFIGLKGQTPGKMALGIQVVNAQGDVIGIWRAALREIVGKFISGIALGLGYAWIGWDREKRAWHDHITSTYVIRKRNPAPFDNTQQF